MDRDSLFKKYGGGEDFVFNKDVVEVFDDMLPRSVPAYHAVIDGIARLLSHTGVKGATVYDLGCSTGATLLELARKTEKLRLRFVGVDNSLPMLEKARQKIAMFSKADIISFKQADILDCDLSDADVIICNYTMQFIRPVQRPGFLLHLFRQLPAGGLLIVCEKVVSGGRLGRSFIDIYHGFKKEQGYSELEIAAKREALENVLIPFTVEENLVMLKEAGFSEVEIFSKWFNFAGFVALKK